MAPLKAIPENLHQYVLNEKEDTLPYRCLICGDRPYFTGYIEKSNPIRILLYRLCQECFENPDSDNAVERIIDYYETTRKDSPDLLEYCGEC